MLRDRVFSAAVTSNLTVRGLYSQHGIAGRAGESAMHSHSIDQWTHDHVFLGAQHDRNERRTWFVVSLTAAMMVGEIVAGTFFGSMALLADGWHMATHAAALGIAAVAYAFARRHARNSHFAFGTGKFGDLAAFSSAIILALIAVQIAYESVVRLFHPVPITYGEAIAVAALGLCVNLASAALLRDSHDHGHSHSHRHDDHDDAHGHHHHDNNLRAAYVHVLADTATSVLAIAALLIAMYSGWVWADPAVGIVGSLVIASWAWGLIRASSAVLLDVNADEGLEGLIRERIETKGDRVTDLHLWQVGPGHRAAVISVVSDHPLPPATYKRRLGGLRGLSHVTVEVETCPDPH
jgi:cation diffusion facilitator family transporter